MGWDFNLNFDGFEPFGADVPAGQYTVEITDATPGEKENVGPKVTFSFKILDTEYKGKVLTAAPYVPGKDFKGTDGQKKWAQGVWHDLLMAVGADPNKQSGKDATKIGRALIGKRLIVVTDQSEGKLTPAQQAAGATPRVFTNIRDFLLYLPNKQEEDNVTPLVSNAEADDAGDELPDMDALA